MLSALAQTVSRLMFLRAGPQDLPSWSILLYAATAGYLLSATARLAMVGEWMPAFWQALISLLVLVVFLRAILHFKMRPERFTQTLAALLIVNTLIGIMMLAPLQALVPTLLLIAEQGDLNAARPPAVAAYAWLLLSFWGLFLAGHVYRHALDVSLALGMGVALCYEILLILVVGLFGAA